MTGRQRNKLVPSTEEERAVPASVIKSRRLICLLQLDSVKRRHSLGAVSKLLMHRNCRLIKRNSRYTANDCNGSQPKFRPL
jgi:hypothetical protein